MGTALTHFTVDEVGSIPGEVIKVVHKLAKGSKTTALNMTPGVFILFPHIKQDSVKSSGEEFLGIMGGDFLQPGCRETAALGCEWLGDGRSLSAEGTGWVGFEGDVPHARIGCIVMQHAAGETGAILSDDFKRFHGLQGPDHAGKGSEDARFFSGRNRARWRRLRKEATVAGRGQPGIKDAKLPLKLMNCASDQRFALEPGGVSHQKAGREIV